MTALDFLSPALARDADGFHPVARSSMERLFRDAGATFEERGGWLVPASVPGEAEQLARVGIADLSHLTKLEVRPAAARRRVAPSPGTALAARALCLCRSRSSAGAGSRLAGDAHVVDVTAPTACSRSPARRRTRLSPA